MEVRYKRLNKGQPALHRAYPGDAGADLLALEGVVIVRGATARVPTNVALALPEGCYGLVAGRSGLNALGILTHIGTIDQGFRGQIQVAMTNLGQDVFVVQPGDRIAQLIILPCLFPAFVEVDELPPSERAERGWGSSGPR